jgi:hypothetical protein
MASYHGEKPIWAAGTAIPFRRVRASMNKVPRASLVDLSERYFEKDMEEIGISVSNVNVCSKRFADIQGVAIRKSMSREREYHLNGNFPLERLLKLRKCRERGLSRTGRFGKLREDGLNGSIGSDNINSVAADIV